MLKALHIDGKPMFSGRDLVKLIIPLVIEQFLAVLVGMADTVMVSGVSAYATSAVSSVDTINNLLINLFSAMGAGGAVVAAQYLGHHEVENACSAAKQLLISSLAVSGGIALISIIGNSLIIETCYGSLNEETKEMCKTYFLLSALSYPFLGIYNGGVGVLRSQGDSRSSMISSTIMNLVNIGGNALLIGPLKMGVAGAGLASLVSRALCAVIIFRILCRKKLKIHLIEPFRPEWDGRMIRRILSIGLPSGAENSLFQVGKVIIMVIITRLPAHLIAANAAVSSVSGFPNIPGAAVGLASIAVIGQCVGAGDEKQARAYGWRLLLIMYAAVLPLNFIIFTFAPVFLSFFGLERTPGAYEAALQIQHIYCLLSLICWVPSFGLPNILRAAGDARYTMT
ncbi:MAG: MATE family efflux transporter, partial [Clostridiales bacterium]|nr:MATE family efflux transporter [Clostridiales bacterium]